MKTVSGLQDVEDVRCPNILGLVTQESRHMLHEELIVIILGQMWQFTVLSKSSIDHVSLLTWPKGIFPL